MPTRFSGPNYVYLQVTRECLGCGWDCYLQPDGTSLSLKEAKEIVDQAKKSKIFLIIIDGGDTLQWDGIYELISYVHSKGLIAGLTAKGEITAEQMKELARAGGRGPPTMLQVPLEGPEEFHDMIRGDGSYRKTLDAIQEAKKYNIEMHVGTTVTRLNLPFIHEVSNTLGNSVGMHRLLRYVPASEKGFLAAEENMKLLDIAYDLRINKKREIALNNCYTFLIASRIGERMKKPESWLGCVAAKTSLYITAEGYILPCPMLSSKDIAVKTKAPQIWKTSIHEAWNQSDFLEKVRSPCIDCRSCRYVETCGGCRATAYHIYGNFSRDPGCPFDTKNTTKLNNEPT